jgi:hypothetical protein
MALAEQRLALTRDRFRAARHEHHPRPGRSPEMLKRRNIAVFFSWCISMRFNTSHRKRSVCMM